MIAGHRGFLDVEQIHVPRSAADAAQMHLRSMGQHGCEGFALWAGQLHGPRFVVTETIIPSQRALKYASGICVRVEGEELFRLNVYLHQTERSLIAQLHSHPGQAYHSDTDDSFPIATTAGAFSIVVPDFAMDDFSLAHSAIYRLMPNEGWVEQSPSSVTALIQIGDG